MVTVFGGKQQGVDAAAICTLGGEARAVEVGRAFLPLEALAKLSDTSHRWRCACRYVAACPA